MIDNKRMELLVKIARLYYENEYSQEEISQMLGLSRPYISKLLNECRKNGIVRFQVVDPLSTESFLEKKFRERFHLKKACIISMPDSSVSLKDLVWRLHVILTASYIAETLLVMLGDLLFLRFPNH